MDLPRDKAVIRGDIETMRKKMVKPAGSNALKYNAGGIIDLEFLVQFLVLAYPNQDGVRSTNTQSQLQQLRNNHVISYTQFAQLKRAYRHYHRALHQHVLQLGSIECSNQQADVLAISRVLYSD